MSAEPVLVVCMGVSGTGKSTLASALAEQHGLLFLEADDYHSDSNKARMAEGLALSDADREPWIKAVCDELLAVRDAATHCVLAHSALRRTHRDQLRRLGFRTMFLHLHGETSVIASRLSARSNHFMPAALLQSQLEALQVPANEPDVYTVDIANTPAHAVSRVSSMIENALQ